MPTFPSRFRGTLYAIGELTRCLVATRSADWVAWYRTRLADQSLDERRRRTLGSALAFISRKCSDPYLALSTWANGRDLWMTGLREPAIAVLACEAALWVKDAETYEAAFAAGDKHFSESTRLRLNFLKSMYLPEKFTSLPREVHLPSGLPHNPELPFVDYYARARAADAENRFDVAREYYLKALDTIPVAHEAYAYARRREYEFRNGKLQESA